MNPCLYAYLDISQLLRDYSIKESILLYGLDVSKLFRIWKLQEFQ